MSPIQYPPVYMGIYVLLITAVSAVMSAQASAAATVAGTLFWAALSGAGLACGWKYNQQKSESLKNASNFIAALALLLSGAVFFSSGIEKAFLVLLIGIQAAINFTLSTRRDFYYSYVISLVLVLHAASASKEALFILYIIIYVLAGVFTLMADHIDETLGRARGGDREALTRRMNLPVKGAGLAAAVIALSLFLYFVVPRPPSPQVHAFPAGGGWVYQSREWERQAREEERRGPDRGQAFGAAGTPSGPSGGRDERRADVDQGYGGFNRKFDITGCGCGPSDELVFYLQSDRPLYVRAKTFDLFDGRAWTNGGEEGRKVLDKGGFSLDKNFRGHGAGQTFTIKADMPPHILAAYRPVMMWFPGSVVGQGDDFSLKAPTFLRKGTVYSVLSDVGDRDGRPFSTGEYHDDLRRYLQLPDNLSQRVKELGAVVTQGSESPYAKAGAIERYLRTNYRYTLDTVLRQPGQDAVDEFLFELKQGHCEYFATAMVVMLRTINIPARLATGYAAYRENTITGYYEVRKKNAHAWVEAHIEGKGWMTFEPTSPFEVPRESKRIFAAAGVIRYLEDRLTAAVRSDPGAWWARALEKIMAFFKWLWRMLKELFDALVSAGRGVLIWLAGPGWKMLLSLPAIAGIARLLYLLVVPLGERIDRELLRKKDARQFILHCYKEVEKALTGKRTPRLPFHAPAEYEHIAAARFPHLAPSLGVITGLFNRARYSPLPIGEEDADSAYRAHEFIMKFIHRKPEEKKGT